MMKKKLAAAVVVMGTLLSFGSVIAFATENKSYLTGQQRSQNRNEVYAQAETMESEEEREAFLNEQGIGETEWSEEAAASYSYITGQQRGASFRTDDDSDTDRSSYSYVTGQQRGSSYQKK
ncbi:hypothetical protein [Butyricicoccus sp.]|uniref:hypothetical protein n=1 Tax=Butyricicoccus sp. TaxID=2049021 RepID=UPI003F142AFE